MRSRFIFAILFVMPAINCMFGQTTKIDSLEKALAAAQTDSARLNLFLSLGKAGFATADYEKGLDYTRRAEALAKKIKRPKEEALSHNIRATILRSMGNYNESLKEHLLALKIRESIADSFGIANSYNNIGLLYWGMEKYDLALNYHTKALRIRESMGDSAVVAASHLNIGMTYYKQGVGESARHPQYAQDLWQSALVSYNRALAYFERKKILPSIAACYNNIANVYADKAGLYASEEKEKASKESYDLSRRYYFKTLAIMEAANDRQSVVITLNNISLIYKEQKNYDSALVYAEKSLNEAKRLEAMNEVQEAYQNLSDLYARKKMFEKAYEYHQLYSATKDSLLNVENNRQVVEMETKYETEKKDKELLKKDAETKQASMQRNFFIAGFGFMLLLAFFIFRGYRQKKKANIEISHQKILVEEKQKEILDSIYYARRIQRTLLPSEKYIQKILERAKKQG